MTGLRFIAAMLVFLFHVTLMTSPIPPHVPVNPFGDPDTAQDLSFIFGKAGFVGVSFFFILSGFVLTWSAKPGEPARAFWRRRLLKIFPNHVVMWAATLILFASAITPFVAWLPNLLLIHSFFPQAEINRSINVPSWTLCCELLFYMLFPLLLHGVRRISEKRLWNWVVVMLGGMLAVALVTEYLIPSAKPAGYPLSDMQFWFGYFFPPVRLFEFVLGILLARIVASGRWPKIGMPHAALLTVGGYVAALYLPFVYGLGFATALPLGAIICAAAAADINGTPSRLRGRTMQWLGDISFGFYLCQGAVVIYGSWLVRGTHDVLTASLIVVALFIATLVAGALLYTCVERPIMRRWSRSRKGQSQPVPVTAEATL